MIELGYVEVIRLLGAWIHETFALFELIMDASMKAWIHEILIYIGWSMGVRMNAWIKLMPYPSRYKYIYGCLSCL